MIKTVVPFANQNTTACKQLHINNINLTPESKLAANKIQFLQRLA